MKRAKDVDRRIVRVGFFSADGYHVMDDNGTMSGYGYDFLQMMLRYNDWKYEYVGYDRNWGDMLDMLDSGEIGLVKGSSHNTYFENGEASGMNGHISKPVNYDKLYQVLEKSCKKEGENRNE